MGCHLKPHLRCCCLQTEAHAPWPPLWLRCTWASHLRWDHAAAPQQTSRNVRQQPQRHGGEISGGARQGCVQKTLLEPESEAPTAHVRYLLMRFSWCVSGDVTTQVSLQPALKFNGGGHVNHAIFWTNLSPNGGGEPQGKIVSYCMYK